MEVEFRKDVQYKSAKVTVKDSSGKTYTARITEKDEDDLTFKVSNIAAGKTYTYTISGVRAGRSGSYGKVTGTFKTPAVKKPAITELDFDRGDRELDIEFNGRVQYKNLKVTVTDAKGISYTVKVLEKDSEGLEVRVSGLRKGAIYKVKVSDVRLRNNGSYTGVTGSFTVR